MSAHIDIRTLARTRLQDDLERAWHARDYVAAKRLIARSSRIVNCIWCDAPATCDALLEWAEIERQSADPTAAERLLERTLSARRRVATRGAPAHVAFSLAHCSPISANFPRPLPHLQRACLDAADTWRSAAFGTLTSVLVALGRPPGSSRGFSGNDRFWRTADALAR